MRKILFFILLLFFTNQFVAQLKAKVKTIYGIEVYIMAEPVREYVILKGSKNVTQWGSGLTRGLVNPSIYKRIEKFALKVKEEYANKGEKIDAILYTKGKSINAIRFIVPPTLENNRIGIIKKVNGIPFFVLNEPLNKYSIVSKKVSNGIKLKSFITLGIANNSIERDLIEFTNKVKRKYKKGKVSALIYKTGKRAISIKLK